MGMWHEGQRHGPGVVVMPNGLYYEGHFSHNRFHGHGLLLTDEDMCYDGDFSSDRVLQVRIFLFKKKKKCKPILTCSPFLPFFFFAFL